MVSISEDADQADHNDLLCIQLMALNQSVLLTPSEDSYQSGCVPGLIVVVHAYVVKWLVLLCRLVMSFFISRLKERPAIPFK